MDIEDIILAMRLKSGELVADILDIEPEETDLDDDIEQLLASLRKLARDE